MESSNSYEPPLYETYKKFLDKTQNKCESNNKAVVVAAAAEEGAVPAINMSRLEASDEREREECKWEIARASEEWGLFHVVRHGIPIEVLSDLRFEQQKLLKQPFETKVKDGSYRWGTPTARCVTQFSWSEAFHIPLIHALGSTSSHTVTPPLSPSIEQFASRSSSLAQKIAEILAEKMGQKTSFFRENCLDCSCYLRLNRYPPCVMGSDVHGLVPHSDSDFLTILHEDQVGGLQLLKDVKWVAVKPLPHALLINIGDLFQAWSNGVYRSVEHRVVTNPQVERFSTAFFFCPSDHTLIQSCTEPRVYRNFSFGEYRQQVRQDVRDFGSKIGLSRFLI